MFFYVDESGHTGTNLFDENQPILYYGVLSSTLNLDALSDRYIAPLRRKLGVERLHAGELGNGKLVSIIDDIKKLQKKFNLRFDMYRVAKADHALICFFDQVFDQGLNPAMTWTGYWTPMRYVLLLKLASLFDDETLKEAWAARIQKNNKLAEKTLISVCKTIRERVNHLPDERSRQLISDSLMWVEQNPSEIQYNANSKSEILSIAPNVIGFQTVMHGIALRAVKQKKKASRIVVDRQSQFNNAQKSLHEFYIAARNIPFKLGPGLPEMDLKNIPEVPISFTAGTESAGLELVDIYLWVFKRYFENKTLAPELLVLLQSQMYRGRVDEISIKAIASRWEKWFNELPIPSDDELKKAKELLAPDEARRQEAVAALKNKV